MPWANNPKIDALRKAYNVAIDAHHGANSALRNAQTAGETPTDSMVLAEAGARQELTDARDRLLGAMSAAIAGHAAAELDPPK